MIVPRDDKGNPVDTDSKSAEAEAAAGKDEKYVQAGCQLTNW